MVDTAGVDFVEFSTAVVIAFPNLVIADFSSVICFPMDAVEVVEMCSKVDFKIQITASVSNENQRNYIFI